MTKYFYLELYHVSLYISVDKDFETACGEIERAVGHESELNRIDATGITVQISFFKELAWTGCQTKLSVTQAVGYSRKQLRC
jgi:hypothetical protein